MEDLQFGHWLRLLRLVYAREGREKLDAGRTEEGFKVESQKLKSLRVQEFRRAGA